MIVINVISVPQHEVTNLILKLKGKLPPGLDNTLPVLIKNYSSCLVSVLTKISILCLYTKTFPDIWKTHEFVPYVKN